MAEGTRLAEKLGFSSVSVSDHVVCPVGPEAAGVTSLWYDWSVLSTYLALQTSRIRIVGSVVVPYRPVLVTAKQIATIDVVSGGRFTLAAAVGWLESEFEWLGSRHDRRGAMTDEYLRAMKILWTEDEPRFSGQHVEFSELVFEPKCVQKPHVPIWVAGGTAPGPVRRLLELGDGWMPMGGELTSELRETIAGIKEGLVMRGRDPDSITFRYTIGIGEAEPTLADISKSIDVGDPSTVGHGGSPEEVAESVGRYADAGFTELAINFSGQTAGEVLEQLDRFGSEVMPLLDRPSEEVPETPA